MLIKLPSAFPEKDITTKFTHAAMQVLDLAQAESRRVRHKVVGTEQILLGLLAEESGLAAQILLSRGVSLETTRREVDRMIEGGFMVDGMEIPLSPTARQSLEIAIDAAFELGHLKVNTGHLLLGLIRQGRQGEAVAVWVLRNLKVDLEKLEQQTRASLSTNIHQEVANSISSNGKVDFSPHYLLDVVSGRIAARLVNCLVSWVDSHQLGEVFNSTIGFQLPNGDILPLGVSFIAKDRLLTQTRAYLNTPPDLVIEIKSINRDRLSIQKTIQTLLSLGSKVGIVIDPDDRTVTVYQSEGNVTVLTDEDYLMMPELFPEWKLLVSSIWSTRLSSHF
jgi:Uma2 family endonuclease